jgi:predicted GNAT family N-acyltransferase
MKLPLNGVRRSIDGSFERVSNSPEVRGLATLAFGFDLMEPKPAIDLASSKKRTTSVRLENLERLETVVREFGFKDRSHFFQLCTDALLRAHHNGQRLDWPPRFVTRD